MAELIYAIRKSDGKTISIYDVPKEQKGLLCECVCLECNTPLEACSLQGKVSPYFRHYSKKRGGSGESGSLCSCNIKTINESGMHKMAKEIIKELDIINIPPIKILIDEIDIPDITDDVLYELKHKKPYVYKKVHQIKYNSPTLEKLFPNFKADASVNTQYGELLIEIAVTHFVSQEKIKYVKRENIPMLEIDLSDYIEEFPSRETLRNIIVNETKNKKWNHYLNNEIVLKNARAYYESFEEVKKYRWKKEQKIKGKGFLEEYLQPQKYKETLNKLRNDRVFIKVANKHMWFYRMFKEIPYFIDIPITGEFVFKCDRRIWQGIIFDRFIFNRKEKESKIPDVDTIFNTLKDNYKISIGEALTYKFEIEREGQTTFFLRKDVIEKYLMYMEFLGFIDRSVTPIGWSVVKENHSTCPPKESNSNILSETLKKVNLFSPDIDLLIKKEIPTLLSIKEKADLEAQKKEIEEKAEKQQKIETEERWKAFEIAEAKKKEENIANIRNFDYENGVGMMWDIYKNRWAKCIICGEIKPASNFKKWEPRNLNLGTCSVCYIKKKENDEIQTNGKKHLPIETIRKKTIQQIREEFNKADFLQNEKIIRDDSGNRWLLCSLCNEVFPDNQMSSYGGKETLNTGICSNCQKKQENL